MADHNRCLACRRALRAPDRGCSGCGRPPIPEQTIRRARELARGFAEAHAGDPWLRSAGLLAYSLRSRRRGFLDDPGQPFTRAALGFLREIAILGGDAGVSPLAETALRDGFDGRLPVLAGTLNQLLDRYRDALGAPGDEFADWYSRL